MSLDDTASRPATATATAPVRTSVATLPRVNLLPPEIAAKARFRRLQYAMGGAVVAAVGVVVVLVLAASHSVSSAQSDLDAAQAQHTTLQKQVSALANVRDTYARVAASEAMLTHAMGREIRWSHYLNDLSLTIPDKVWLTNLTFAEDVDGAGSAANSASLVPTGIGTVSASGTAFTHDDVAAWLESLATEKGYAGAYFSNSTETPIGTRPFVNFTSTVTVTDAALSGCYTKPGPSSCDATTGGAGR